jgi:hypothetical protein
MLYKICHASGFTKNEMQVDWVENQNYHVDEPYSYYNCPQGEPLKGEKRLPIMKFVHGAKISDYLNVQGVNSNFMVLSSKCLQLFSNLNCLEYKAIDMKVFKGETELIYIGLHFESKVTGELINWKLSSFKYNSLNNNQDSLLQFNSYEEYLHNKRNIAQESNGQVSVRPFKIVLNNLTNKYDLFYSSTPFSGIFCNSNFLELIINENLTGFRVEKVNET